MRHRKKGKKLRREKGPRQALAKSLAISLILHEKIKTTQAKAKFIRPLVEKVINLGKEKSLSSKRRIFQLLSSKEAQKKIIKTLGPKYKEKKGGYTRIIKLGPRSGDGAFEVIIELT